MRKKWYSNEVFNECKSNPIAVFLGDQLICGDRSQHLIECIDMNTGDKKMLQVQDEIRQMTTYDNILYVASKRFIIKYDFLAETWIKVNSALVL